MAHSHIGPISLMWSNRVALGLLAAWKTIYVWVKHYRLTTCLAAVPYFNLRFICVFRWHLILLFSLSFLLRYVLFHTFLPLAILVCGLYFPTYSSSLFFLFSKLPRGRSVEWCIHSKKRSAFTSKWCQLSCEHCPTYCCRNVLACWNDKINNIMVIKPLPKKNITLRWRNDGGNKTHNHLQQLMQITTNLPQSILLTTCLMICPCSAW